MSPRRAAAVKSKARTKPAVAPTSVKSLREQGKDAQRRAVLDTASRLLAEQGPEALSLRALAQAVSTSTMVLYTLFGGKEGLIRALHDEAFERLGDALAAVKPQAKPLDTLWELGLEYRRTAIANPSYFAIILGRPIPGVAPPSAQELRGRRSYRLFLEAVEACMARGALPPGDPEDVADALWATAHGMISLELSGYFPTAALAEARYRKAIDATCHGFAVPQTRGVAKQGRP